MARLILTEPGEDVEVGGNVTVVGTSAPGEVITVLKGNIVLDPSFNQGGDTIRLPDEAGLFTVRIFGSNVILVGATVTVSIPVGPAGLQVAFDDVARTLLFDTALGVAKLGTQIITHSETGVLPAGGTSMTVGTGADDTIDGTANAEVIDGLAGNDTISGGAGDDVIRGGLDNDVLTGGFGDDEIYGGVGDDQIRDDEGGYGLLDGGAGNDSIIVTNLEATVLEITGGDGDDVIGLRIGDSGIAYVSAGAGTDRVSIVSGGMEANLQLGTGRDEIVLPAAALGSGTFGVITVQDFEPGALGDRVDLADALSSYLVGWDSNTNPFATGHLKLVDRFESAVLQVDRDGSGGPEAAKDLISFAGVEFGSLTADNFNGFNPQAAPTGSAAGAFAMAGDLIFDAAGAIDEVAYAPADFFEPYASLQGHYFLA